MSPGAMGCEVRAGGGPLLVERHLGRVVPDDQTTVG